MPKPIPMTPAIEAARLAYWSAKLDDAPPGVELAADSVRGPGRSTTAIHRFEVEPKVLRAIEKLCLLEGVPTIDGLTAAFAALLGRLAGQKDLVVGVATSIHEGIAGNIPEIVPVRVDVGADRTFRDLMRRVAADLREAHEHQLPLETLANRRAGVPDPSRAPIVQVVVCDDFPVVAPGSAAFDLELRVKQGDTALTYRADLFDRARISELVSQLGLVLRAFARAPDERVQACSLVTPRAREVVPDLSSIMEAPHHEPVVRTTASLAARAPRAPAMEWRGTVWTFADLEARATNMAAALRARGVARGDRVVVSGPRCPAIAAGFLAVWKCGAVIVPLSESLPRERQRVMARESGAVVAIIVGDEPTDESLPVVRVVAATGQVVGQVGADGADAPLPAGQRSPAYVFFTSGTTGTPKGVLGTHDGLAHFLRWQRETFGISASDRAAQLTGLSFDVVMRDMLTPLSAGATLCFPERDAASLDPEALHAWLRDARITIMHSVPSVLESWLAGWRGLAPLADVRLLFMAGEPLSDTLVRECRARFPRCRVINLYGPTETTLAKCFHELPKELASGTQPVGRPMSHTQAIIMSEAGVPCGLGEIGEIVIRTPFRTLGYLGEAARSSGRFRPNPFRDDPDDLLYATGDRGRYRLTGEIEIHGRVDDQVKIHGVRVQPAEVAAVIRAHPEVATCFVGAFDEGDGHTGLCAYVVLRGRTPTDVDDLRRHLADRLPAAMVPGAFMFLDRLPLSANGKVDRRTLPPPISTRAAKYEAPASPTEELLADLWSSVLRVKAVGRRDNFFNLGGQSLVATQIASRLRKEIGVDLHLRALFEHPTIAQLAPVVDAQRGRGVDESAVLSRQADDTVVSFAETRLWFLEQLDPGQPTYNLPLVLRLRGVLDPSAMERAVTALSARHDSLRTRFATDADGPRRIVEPPSAVPLQCLSVEGGSEAEREHAARRAIAAATGCPFDLERGPLFRATLIKIGPTEHVLVLATHHIISDGLSLEVLEHDLGVLYAALRRGEASPLAELPTRYADYAAWQRTRLTGSALEKQLEYWKAHLAGAPANLDLPTDRPRPPVKRSRGSRVPVALPRGIVAKVSEVARREDATPFMVLLAVFEVLLARHTGQNDIVVGMPIANRTRAELEGLVGFFVNTLALRTTLDGEPTFREVVQRVKRASLGAYEHQDLPFERLVEELKPPRDTSRTPLFQVMFAHQAMGAAPSLDGLEVSVEPDGLDVAKFDLTLFVEERPGELSASLQYDSSLFDRSTAERMAERYGVLLGAALEDLDTPVAALRMMSAEERRRVVVEWNATRREQPLGHCIDDLFEAQAARTPDAVALVLGSETMTYRELAEASSSVAAGLRAAGIQGEAFVGISTERSVDLVVGLLGILKAGAAYVPLDPSYPPERIALLVREAHVQVVLDPDGRVRVPEHVRTVRTSELRSQAPMTSKAPAPRRTAGGAAYVLFTSGSTGTPKAVCVEHRSVVRLVRDVSWATFATDDVFFAYAPLSFDASTLEIWAPLLNGSKLVIAPPGLLGIDELARNIREQRITFLWLTAGLFHQLVDQALGALATVRQLFAGGDVLSPAHVRRVLRELPEVKLVNGYGPTENTTFTTCHEIRALADGETVPIGRPITNTTVYLLDAQGEPTPIGVPGELYTGGVGVARGYARAAPTAERFVPDPFSSDRGARLYRTGDLARWRADGTIDFLGRRDGQVKLRGYRIELGEIEAVLAAAPHVREVSVIAREDEPGDKRLVAYVVALPGEDLDVDTLRSGVRAALPDYMVPSAFVMLDELPLTTNGKVDRKALPAPDFAAAAAAYVAPRTATEEAIASVWKELLRVERVGAHDDFFALGGHSLLATRASMRLRAALGVDVRVRTLFELPTVSALAERLVGEKSDAGSAPIARVGGAGPLVPSFAQERLWFLAQLEPDAATYNVPVVLRLRGALDVDALARSVSELVQRHDVLRTTFEAVDGRPLPVVRDSQPVALAVHEAADEAEARARVQEEAKRPFDLASGPLFRATLVRFGAEEQFLVLAMHHVVTDGWSMGVLERELAALYHAFRRGLGSPLAALPIQYPDYAAWQRGWLTGRVLEEQLAYWKEHLRGAPTSLELPTDHPRPLMKRYRGGTVRMNLPRGTASKVSEAARREDATPFMVLLAAFDVLLARHTGQKDIVVGTPIANRARTELEGLVGFFVNTLALRTTLEGAVTFREVVQRVKGSALGAYEHQDLPFERLVEELKPPRDTSRTPIFQVMFAYQTLEAAPSLDGLVVSLEPDELEIAKFDLTLFVEERQGELEATLQYDSDLFERGTAERIAQRYGVLLGAALDQPQECTSRLALMPESEQQQLVDWNATARTLEDTRPIHQLFEAEAARSPDRIAVEIEGATLTYGELDARANDLAHVLRKHGVGRDVLVAVSMDRSLELVIALYAVLKAGGAYAPLDPGLPSDRLAFMTRDLDARVILVRSGADLGFDVGDTRIVTVDAQVEVRQPSKPEVAFDDVQLAYVIYTSGSTGTPKAAMNTHAGLRNRLLWMQDAYRLGAHDRVLQKTPFTFDVSVWEFFWPLAFGARLVMARPEGHKDPAYLAEVFQRAQITTAHFVPSMLQAFLEEPTATRGSLTRVICSGEALPRTLASRFHERIGSELHNLYGPTEASIDVTYWPCARGDAREVPIGRPIWNTQIHVVDENGTRCPIGVVGEIWIGGMGVGRGYWRRPELTAAKFIADPFSSEPGRYLYRAGDLGRYRPDGAVEYLGRTDHQVKVRGLRIELGEIEAAIAACRSVREAVVVAREDAAGDKRLVAYVVGANVDVEAITSELRRTLPDYMVPGVFVTLDAFPLTTSGKVDRKALPAPDFAAAAAAYVAPRTPTEEAIADVWKELLRVERVGAHDDFFALGGHSLLATRAAVRLRAALGVDVRVRTLFELPTVSSLAERLSAAKSEAQVAPIVRFAGAGPIIASFAQDRLWFLAQLEPDAATYNVPLALRLRGALDVEALARSVSELVRRHEVLRTTFDAVDGRPQPVVHGPERVSLVVEQVANETDARARLQVEAKRPFDLGSGPLFRANLLRLGAEDHFLALVMHHVVTDGWSMGVLEQELAALYHAFRRGLGSPLAALPIQYSDYALWQRGWLTGRVLEEQLAYWKEHLRGAPPNLELPTDHARPSMKQYRGGSVRVELPRGTASKVSEAARREDATPFMVLLAAFDVLLARHTGQKDIVVGTPIANRTRAELEGLVGFFVNTLALRTRLDGEPTFRDVVQRVKCSALGAYEHQDLPFERLVGELKPPRDTSRTPLFQVMFAYQAMGPAPSLDGLVVELEPDELDVAKFDLALFVEERKGELRASLQYDASLFDRATAERMGERYGVVLEAALEHLDAPVATLPLMSAEERRRVVVEWNATHGEQPISRCVDALFDEQAARAPDAVALVLGSETMTYGELAQASSRVAAGLRALGIREESFVGIATGRSIDLIVALLGILKAGAAYVPLDPSYPPERIALLVREARVELVLDPDGRVRVPEHVRTVRTSELREHAPMPSPAPARSASGAAFVLFTSGSTGTPKGVCIEHRSVVRLVRDVGWATLDPTDVFLAYAPLAFDASTFEIWGALVNGAKLVIAPPGPLGIEELAEEIRAQGVTSLLLTSGLFHQVVDHALHALVGVRQFFSGGDVLSPAHVRRCRRELPHVKLLNVYGPTENTTFTTIHDIRELADGEAVPIGCPITNTTVYVLDPEGQPTPTGVPGELYTGGVGVARGYVRPAITAEKFVPDPFSSEPGARLYRTGDLARWRADGTIDFLGRRDGQVKLRGFRIELGEIESVLAAAPHVREVSVIAREDEPGDKRLVAYLVAAPGQQLDIDTLRSRVRVTLPDYMVPSAFMVLDELPLTSNGKIDRKALPAPDFAAAAAAYLAPRTRIETTIAEIWCGVLGLDRVGVHDDFFALGGHSLLATRVASQLRTILGVVVPVKWLFEAPVLEALAKRVSAARVQGTMPPAPRDPTDSGPLRASFAQERMWFLTQLDPGAPTYNVPIVLRFRGALDSTVLARSIAEVVRRHESLRTTLREEDGALYQVIHESVDLPFVTMDAADEADLRARVRAEVARPFDLEIGPVLRTTLIRLSDVDRVFVVVMHHVVTDGWSIEVIRRELRALCTAFNEGNPSPLRPLPIQYADYSAWQRHRLRGPLLEKQVEYWRTQLAGAPASLDLPTDRPRPAMKQYRGASAPLDIPVGVAGAVAELARREGGTPFMVLLAAFAAVLGRHARQSDVVIGTPIANRTRPEVEGLVGFFANTLPLRTKLDGAPTFRELVQRVKQTVLGAFQYEDVPFERLVEELKPQRDTSRTPIFQVMFTHSRALPGLPGPPGWQVTVESGELEVSKFDLSLSLEEKCGELEGSLEYDTDLFDRSTAERIAESVGVLLASAVDRPDTPALALPMMSEQQRERILVEWNRTTPTPERKACLHELFSEQAARTPSALAVKDETTAVTYAELEVRSSALARHLVARGVARGDVVALLVTRSVDAVIAMLGVLKTGAAYLPIDPDQPAARIRYMIDDSSARAVVVQDAAIDSSIARIVIRLADVTVPSTGEAALPRATPADRAYVIYTSGSTGLPKGVCIGHETISTMARVEAHARGADEQTRFSQYANLSFDAHVLEIWPALVAGASVHFVPDAVRLETQGLIAWIARERIRACFLPTPIAEQCLRGEWPPCELENLNLGGDVLRSVPASAFRFRIRNCYGPTECTCVTTACFVEPGDERPAIGRPLPGVRVYVLDEAGQPTTIGVPGELHLGGAHVGQGYLGRPGLTAEKFVPDPFADQPGARLYRTGDLTRLRPDGMLEFLGRIDHQVKIRGNRVELGEIDAAVAAADGVRESIVVVREDEPGDKRLVAYVAALEGERLDIDTLKSAVRRSLPEYMVPSAFVVLDELPLTANGKIDRKALPRPDFAVTAAEYVAPRTPTEKVIAEIWRDVLGLERAGVHDDFFALGGHSLLGVKVVALVRARLQCTVPVATLFDRSTVERFAAAVDAGTVEALPLVRLREGAGAAAIVCIAPIGGDVIGYADLVRSLDESGPVLGVRAAGVADHDSPLQTVEAIAAEHIANLRRAHPGPYVLVGWSFGGVVAFEMARQLVEMGAILAEVVAVDAYPTAPSALPNQTELLVDYLRDAAATRQSAPLPFAAGLDVEAVWELVVRSGHFSANEVSILRRSFAVYEANMVAYARYTLAPAPVAVRWICATESERAVDVGGARAQWKTCALSGLLETRIEADHYSVMRAPAVSQVVRVISNAITADAKRRGLVSSAGIDGWERK